MTAPLLGADPVELERLAASFHRAGEALAAAASRLRLRSRSLEWTGPTADRFRDDWERIHQQLRQLAQRCERASGTLRQQAARQRSASAPGRAGAVPGRSPSRSESLVIIGGEVRTGPLRFEGRVGASIEELDHQQSRVTVSDVVGGGFVAAVGAIAEVGCGTRSLTPIRTLSNEAELTGGALLEHRTVWEVPDDDVHELLVRQALQRAATATPLGPLAGLVAAHGAPPIVGHEVLAHVAAATSVSASVGGPLGPGISGGLGADAAVGIAWGSRHPSTLIVEGDADLVAAIQPGLLSKLGVPPGSAGTQQSIRLELPRADGPALVEVRSVGRDGTVRRVVATGNVDRNAAFDAAVRHLHTAIVHHRAPSRALVDTLIGGLRGGIDPVQVRVDQLHAATTGCHARLAGGEVLTLGAAADVHIVNLQPE
ncbi:MAG: hypothetical protein ACKOYM_00215 [Actinomycetes bacterium]